MAVITELERLIAAGLPQEVASRLAGVPDSTLRLWLREAAKGKGGLYGELLSATTRARGKAEAVAIAKVRQADDWRASAWWLSHHPSTRDRWSDAGATRTALDAQLALVVKVLEAEIPDATHRHRVLTAMVAAGCGQLPEAENAEG